MIQKDLLVGILQNKMSKVSVIIPARNEKYLDKTVEDLFSKARGEIEVVVTVDGPTNYPLPTERPNLKFIKKPIAEGLRPALRDASKVATGKYLMKTDAHMMMSEGFDEVLKRDFEDNWVVVPRLCLLNADMWEKDPNIQNDYFFLSCPWGVERVKGSYLFREVTWVSRDRARKDIVIDETMSVQGSVWFMTADYFHNRFNDLCDGFDIWGTWSGEQQEIGLKTWLGGGKLMVNKNVWNAHYSKRMWERLESVSYYSRNEDATMHKNLALYFLKNQWKDRVHDFDWLMDRFWPLPTASTVAPEEKYFWPDDWRSHYNEHFKR